ncbi:MAG: ABC transporter substrate-binding protein [Nitratireductor sp.]
MFSRKLLAAIATLPLMTNVSLAADPSNWDSVKAEAKGQTVFFNAWGGSSNINAYIAWAGDIVLERYGVTVQHVKLKDTADAVNAVVNEKAAGKNDSGKIDLIWINGENFVSMKNQNLLFAPDWTTKLPNYKFVDYENQSTITVDFTEPTDGLESPWGGAKMVFFHDSANTKKADLPLSFSQLVEWTVKNPGRFTYPAPPDFIGSSFLKQALSETVVDPAILLKPVVEADFEKNVEPLFAALDKMHPNLWRNGRAYPKNLPAMNQLMADNEVDISFAFNPSAGSANIKKKEWPNTIRSFTFPKGTLGNTHFVAIPYNSTAKAGALIFANFLISPEAQLTKQNPEFWGDPTVLNMSKLSAEDQAAFASIDLGEATLKPSELGPKLPEPHASWMTNLEKLWAKRYGVAN